MIECVTTPPASQPTSPAPRSAGTAVTNTTSADATGDLTRDEARTRAGVVRDVRYAVELDLSAAGSDPTFASRTIVRFAATPGAATFLDLIAAQVHRVTLNGRDVTPDGEPTARLHLTDLAATNDVVVEATCEYVRTGQGLHRFVDPADGEVYLYSQLAEMDARRVFACFDQPDVKATLDLTVLAPDHWAVISNSDAPEPTTQPDARTREVASRAHRVARWTFATTPVMSTYLMAVVAGPYVCDETTLSTANGTIPARVWGRPALREHLAAPEVFRATQAGLDFYERAFDLAFPYDSYDQVYVPEYNLGAMENVGCVTISEDTLLFRSRPTRAEEEFRTVVVLHELAHMWFGDLVTMRWWDDLWLNESFAEFAGTLTGERVTEHTDAWVSFGVRRKSVAYRIDQLSTSHPVIGDVPSVAATTGAFDMITYAKGASVLRQLAHTLGEDAFFHGVGAYLRAHREGNATLTELLVELERASGRDLAEWARVWLALPGVTTLRAEVETDADGVLTSVRILEDLPQIPDSDVAQPHRPHRLRVGGYVLRTDDDQPAPDGEHTSPARPALVRAWVEDVAVHGPTTPLPGLVGRAAPDLLLVNDDDLTYAKVVLDSRSLKTVLHHPEAVGEPMLQHLVLTSLWHACRDGRLAAPAYVRAALGVLAVASSSTTIATTCANLVTAVQRYAAPDGAASLGVDVADALWQLVRDAEPGSDAQLQLLRGYLAIAGTAEQAERALAVVRDEGPVRGVTVDVDLRWAVLRTAVACGVAGEAEIAAELARDDTAAGRRRAAGARAAAPTPEAKLAAWRDIAAPDGEPLANATMYAVADGLTRVVDPAVLAPLVPEWFATIRAFWDSTSPNVAKRVVAATFPVEAAGREPDLVEQAEAWLAANADAPRVLRSTVQEGLEETRRALVAQGVA